MWDEFFESKLYLLLWVDVTASLKKYSFLVMHINISARKNLYHK